MQTQQFLDNNRITEIANGLRALSRLMRDRMKESTDPDENRAIKNLPQDIAEQSIKVLFNSPSRPVLKNVFQERVRGYLEAEKSVLEAAGFVAQQDGQAIEWLQNDAGEGELRVRLTMTHADTQENVTVMVCATEQGGRFFPAKTEVVVGIGENLSTKDSIASTGELAATILDAAIAFRDRQSLNDTPSTSSGKEAEHMELAQHARDLGVTLEQLQAEYDAVAARYKDTPQWMKAPNGEPTKLTERQWVLVRTPRFKAWFGNWEMQRDKELPVIEVAERIFDGDRKAAQEWLTDKAHGIVGTHGNDETRMQIAVSAGVLKGKSTSGAAQDKSKGKAGTAEDRQRRAVDHYEVMRQLPSLLKHASLVAAEAEKNNDRNVLGVYKFVVPARVDSVDYAVKLTVKDHAQGRGEGSRFYTHELVDIEIGMPTHNITANEGEPARAMKGVGIAYSVGELVDAVNRADAGAIPGASQVIDPETGEPRVVYRGTPEKMGNTFEYGQNFYGGNKGFWFTTAKSAAKDYAFNEVTGETGEIKEVFLSARDVLDLTPLGINTTSKRFCDFIRETTGIDLGRGSSKEFRVNELYEKHQSLLYPGKHHAIKMADVGHTYIVKLSNQIKSATHNIGTYSERDNDIRFQAAWHGTLYEFEQFSLDHIGSGQGAQVHGWGLYFARGREIAESYRRLAEDGYEAYIWDGERIEGGYQTDSWVSEYGEDYGRNTPRGRALWALSDADGDKDEALFSLEAEREHIWRETVVAARDEIGRTAEEEEAQQQWIAALESRDSDAQIAAAEKMLDVRRKTEQRPDVMRRVQELLAADRKYALLGEAAEALRAADVEATEPRRIYAVDLPEDTELMREDAPLIEQPPQVRERLTQMYEAMAATTNDNRRDHAEAMLSVLRGEGETATYTAKAMYNNLALVLGNEEDASRALSAAGIPGWSYEGALDGECFVIWNEAAIRVMETQYKRLSAEEMAAQGAFEFDAPPPAPISEEHQAAVDTLNRRLALNMGEAWENAYAPTTLPPGLADVADAMKAAFGRTVRPIVPTSNDGMAFGGVYISDRPGEVFVNIRNNSGFIQLAGHELLHELQHSRPDLYKWFVKEADSYLVNVEEYRERRNLLGKATGEGHYDLTQAKNEILADFAGDTLADEQFLGQLAKSNSKRFGGLLTTATKWLDKVKGKLLGLQSSQYVTEVDALRDKLAAALMAYATNKSIDDVLNPRAGEETVADSANQTLGDDLRAHGIYPADEAEARNRAAWDAYMEHSDRMRTDPNYYPSAWERLTDYNIAQRVQGATSRLARARAQVERFQNPQTPRQKGALTSSSRKLREAQREWERITNYQALRERRKQEGTHMENAEENKSITLLQAAERGQTETIRLLIENGADVNATGYRDWTALMYVAEHGHADIARLLAEHDADERKQRQTEESSENMAAAAEPHISTQDANTAAKDDDVSMLMNAAQEGNTATVRQLIENGADVNAADRFGRTALMSAAVIGDTDTARLLIEHGANVDTADGGFNWTALMYAAWNGQTDTARLLIESGADVNTVDEDGDTALIAAARQGHADAARLLIESGADVNVASDTGWTPLMAAAWHGQTDTPRLLIENGADVNAANDGTGWTPLTYAAQRGHTDIAHLLIEHGADVNTTSEDGWTPLMFAALRGHTDTTRLLIEHGANVNAASEMGWTPLMYAARWGHSNTARLLIEHGADINITSKDGKTALSLAAKHGHYDITRLIGGSTQDANTAAEDDDVSMLMNAAQQGETAAVRQLIEQGVDVNAIHRIGITPLMEACAGGHTDTARLLIESGANVDAVDDDDETALMYAAREDRSHTARLLIEHGADVNAANSLGWTSLMTATNEGHTYTVRLLIERGADVNAADSFGRTALMYAAQEGYPDIARQLIEHGANVDAPDKDGWTALMLAAARNTDIARLLIEHGANVNAADKDGWPPLMFAARYGHIDPARLLIKHGADINITNKDGQTALMVAAEYGHDDITRLIEGKPYISPHDDWFATQLRMYRVRPESFRIDPAFESELDEWTSDVRVVPAIKEAAADEPARYMAVKEGEHPAGEVFWCVQIGRSPILDSGEIVGVFASRLEAEERAHRAYVIDAYATLDPQEQAQKFARLLEFEDPENYRRRVMRQNIEDLGIPVSNSDFTEVTGYLRPIRAEDPEILRFIEDEGNVWSFRANSDGDRYYLNPDWDGIARVRGFMLDEQGNHRAAETHETPDFYHVAAGGYYLQESFYKVWLDLDSSQWDAPRPHLRSIQFTGEDGLKQAEELAQRLSVMDVLATPDPEEMRKKFDRLANEETARRNGISLSHTDQVYADFLRDLRASNDSDTTAVLDDKFHLPGGDWDNTVTVEETKYQNVYKVCVGKFRREVAVFSPVQDKNRCECVTSTSDDPFSSEELRFELADTPWNSAVRLANRLRAIDAYATLSAPLQRKKFNSLAQRYNPDQWAAMLRYTEQATDKQEPNHKRERVIGEMFLGDAAAYEKSLETYMDGCAAFAEESAEWLDLDPYRFYSVDMWNKRWEESGDNASGSVDCRWAFHREREEILREAEASYLDEALLQLYLANNEEYDQDQLARMRQDFTGVDKKVWLDRQQQAHTPQDAPYATCVPTQSQTGHWGLNITTAGEVVYRDVGLNLAWSEEEAFAAAAAIERGDADTLERYGVAINGDELLEVFPSSDDKWHVQHKNLHHNAHMYGAFDTREDAIAFAQAKAQPAPEDAPQPAEDANEDANEEAQTGKEENDMAQEPTQKQVTFPGWFVVDDYDYYERMEDLLKHVEERGYTTIIYQDSDRSLYPVENIDGQWWVRGNAPADADRSKPRFAAFRAGSPIDEAIDKPLAAVQAEIERRAFDNIELRHRKQTLGERAGFQSSWHEGREVPTEQPDIDSAHGESDARDFKFIANPELRDFALDMMASNARSSEIFNSGVYLSHVYRQYPEVCTAVVERMQERENPDRDPQPKATDENDDEGGYDGETYILNGESYTNPYRSEGFWVDSQGKRIPVSEVTQVLDAMAASVKENGRIDTDFMFNHLDRLANETYARHLEVAVKEIGETEEEYQAYRDWQYALEKDDYDMEGEQLASHRSALDAWEKDFRAAEKASRERPEVQQRLKELLDDDRSDWPYMKQAMGMIMHSSTQMEYRPASALKEAPQHSDDAPRATCVPTQSQPGQWGLTITTAEGTQYRDVGATLLFDEEEIVTVARMLERGDDYTLSRCGIALDDDDLWEVRWVERRDNWIVAHNGVIQRGDESGEVVQFATRDQATAWAEELRGRTIWSGMSYDTRRRALHASYPYGNREMLERQVHHPSSALTRIDAREIGKRGAAFLHENPAPTVMFSRQDTSEPSQPEREQTFADRRAAQDALIEKLLPELSQDEIAMHPFSETWPENIIDSIEDDRRAAMVWAMRAHVGQQPSYADEIRRWAQRAFNWREQARDVLRAYDPSEYYDWLDHGHIYKDRFAHANLLTHLPREDWRRISDVEQTYTGIRLKLDGRSLHVTYGNEYVRHGKGFDLAAEQLRLVLDGKPSNLVEYDDQPTVMFSRQDISEQPQPVKLPDDWDGKPLEVAARVLVKDGDDDIGNVLPAEHYPDKEPVFWGVYARLQDGTCEWLEDFDTPEDAQRFAQELYESQPMQARLHDQSQGDDPRPSTSQGEITMKKPAAPQPAKPKMEQEDGSSICVFRGFKTKLADGSEYPAILVLKKPNEDFFRCTFVDTNGKKQSCLAFLNHRNDDPNVKFFTLSTKDKNGKTHDYGYGNVINRRSDGKQVFFDQAVFNINGSVSGNGQDMTITAFVGSKVDAALHKNLGFEQDRIQRPDPANKVADAPKPEAPSVKDEATDAPQKQSRRRTAAPAPAMA